MKKISAFSFVIAFLYLSSCVSGTNSPQVLPTNTTTDTPSATIVTNTPVPAAESTSTITVLPPTTYLSEIHMMDEKEGWALLTTGLDGTSKLLHTSDGGESWENITPSVNRGRAFFLNGEVAWVPLFDASRNFISTLLQTTDGGKSWKTVNSNMQAVDRNPFFHNFGFEDAMNGWWRTGDVSTGSAYMYYYQTKDGGTTWQLINVKAPPDDGKGFFPNEATGEIVVCHVCNENFYFDLQRVIISPSELPKMLLTTNFGETWNDIELPDFPANVPVEEIYFNNPTFFDKVEGVLPIIVKDPNTETGQIYIYGTQDNGLTWSLESNPTLIKQYYGYGVVGVGFQFLSRLEGFLTLQNGLDGLSVTHDGGKTWTQILLPGGFKSSDAAYIEMQLDFIDSATGWIILKKRSKNTGDLLVEGIFKTTNGGISWTEIVPIINE